MTFLNFLIQVNVYLFLFYLFYVLLLRNETFFTLNRLFLNTAAIISLSVPIMEIEWIKSLFISEKIQETAQVVVVMAEPVILTAKEESGFSIVGFFTIVYAAGAIFFFLRFLLAIFKISFNRFSGSNAYSFFGRVVVTRDLPQRETILKHEFVHARQLHSLDVIFFELLAVLNWFNPVVYLYKRSIQNIHEFIADEVAAMNQDKSEYANLLLHEAMGIKPHQLANNFFNESLLKKRIFMLSKTKSKKIAVLKYGFFAPMFGGMLIFSSAFAEVKMPLNKLSDKVLSSLERDFSSSPNMETTTEQDQHLKENSSISDAKKKNAEKQSNYSELLVTSARNLALSDTSQVFSLRGIDVMPEYPGGIKEFYNYVGKSYNFPKEAKEKGLNGMVVLSFVVEKDGSLTDFKLLRDLGMGTGEEAVRVLKTSPKWKPGLKNGNPVRVEYTIPIKLNLESKDKGLNLKGPDIENAYILVDGKHITRPEMQAIDPKSIDSISVVKDKVKFSEYGAPQDATTVIIIKLKKQ